MESVAKNKSLVGLHNSWLVINSIVGCTNGCKYCFLNKGNSRNPSILGTPEEAVIELIHYRYYDESIPLCLFPNTDIFLNQSNIKYLLETLTMIEKYKIKNDIIIITKCYIPDEVLRCLKLMQRRGYKIVIYLSYSGLDNDIEPYVNHKDIQSDFVRLKRARIPCIHYYRPFLPQNSSSKQIKSVLDYVHKYTPLSIVTGLMFLPSRKDFFNFWKELEFLDFTLIKHASSIWPEEAWNYFQLNYHHKQQIYYLNTCAFASLFKRPVSMYFNSNECKNCSHCNKRQRRRCKRKFEQFDIEQTIKKLEMVVHRLEIYNRKFVFHADHSLEIIGKPLNCEVLTYMSFILQIHVFMENGRGLGEGYHSNCNGGKPYILREVQV